jgi:hypothetical protein
MALSPDGSQIYMPGETSLAILDVSTLALSIAPLTVGKIAVAADGTVYGDNTSGTTSSIVVIDPVLWTVTATYAADDANFFALSPDGSRLYLFSSQSSLVSMTGAVPSETLTRSGPTGEGPEYGAYDAKDGLVLLPDFWGDVNVLDSKTLRLRGSIMTGYPCEWVVFGDTGYAVCGVSGEQPGPQVTQFDPVSLKVTGSVTIPYPADDDTGFYAQPVLDANFLYVPFNFYPASSGVRPAGTGSPAATGAVSYGIAVIDIAKMALAAIFPLNVAQISGFAIASGSGNGYLSIALESPYSGELLEISLRTGAILRTAQLPENGYVAAAPDGSTIYVSTPGTLYAVSTQTLTIVNSATGLYFGYLSVTPDGAYIYGTTNSGVTIVSTSSLAVVGTIPSTATTNAGAVIFVQE